MGILWIPSKVKKPTKNKTKSSFSQAKNHSSSKINLEDIPYLPSAGSVNENQKRLMNKVWYDVFSNNQTFSLIAPNQKIKPEPGNGLIYCFSVKGIIRYIGKTKKSLRSRMLTKYENGRFGYNYTIKRLVINAYRNNFLQIATSQVPIDDLVEHEKYCINFFGKNNNLWNIANNRHYKFKNRYMS